jgi:hypothetical protein
MSIIWTIYAHKGGCRHLMRLVYFIFNNPWSQEGSCLGAATTRWIVRQLSIASDLSYITPVIVLTHSTVSHGNKLVKLAV